MRVGIDASNLRRGGTITHLVEILREVQPSSHGIDEIVVWVGKDMLARLEPTPWLRLVHDRMLDHPLPVRTYWQHVRLPRLARSACDVLFAPGGRASRAFRPIIAMSRNLLPFEPTERGRYGISWMHFKMVLLSEGLTASFRRADGVIFLNQYACDVVMRKAKKLHGRHAIIPHGVGHGFFLKPRNQSPVSSWTMERPMKLLYVSDIDVYKHQWHVAEAVSLLRREGLPVQLEMVGPAYPPALRRLERSMTRLDPLGEYLRYTGPVSSAQLPGVYHQADLAIFASSCENMPNILLESMAAGLPVACSSRGPMPSILGEAGVYFDPERPDEIAAALRSLIVNPQLRLDKSQLAYRRAQAYSWKKCAEDTFAFIARIGGASLD